MFNYNQSGWVNQRTNATMSVRITCINKDNGNHYNAHEAITDLGWINESTKETGISTRQIMVGFIEKGNSAYVYRLGNKAYLIVRTSVSGRKYVQTLADGKLSDNLLELPECKG